MPSVRAPVHYKTNPFFGLCGGGQSVKVEKMPLPLGPLAPAPLGHIPATGVTDEHAYLCGCAGSRLFAEYSSYRFLVFCQARTAPGFPPGGGKPLFFRFWPGLFRRQKMDYRQIGLTGRGGYFLHGPASGPRRKTNRYPGHLLSLRYLDAVPGKSLGLGRGEF